MSRKPVNFSRRLDDLISAVINTTPTGLLPEAKHLVNCLNECRPVAKALDRAMYPEKER